MSFFGFIRNRKFFKHFFLAAFTTLLILLLGFYSINLYTHHGEAISIPDLRGFEFVVAEKIADGKGFRVEIYDSVHFQEKEKGTVTSQIPEPDSKVKQGRVIYVVINGFGTESVLMPDLRGISVRQATADAELFGLKIGKLSYVPDISTTVLDQHFRGSVIKPGALIERGSVIDLVVGKGESNEKTIVPNVVGLTIEEAEAVLLPQSLNIGVAVFDNSVLNAKDTAEARIWKQFPRNSKDAEIKLGSYVDVWLTKDNDLLPEEINNTPANDF